MPNYKDFDLDIQNKKELHEIKDLNRKDANSRTYNECTYSYCDHNSCWPDKRCMLF